ncbi:MAG: NAD-dependent epimerase/dehydratase family protein, partial [Armatimonadota bacterium]
MHEVLESTSTKTGNMSLESPIVLAVVGGGPLACNRYGLTGASGFIGRALQRRMLSEGLKPNCFTGDILSPSGVMKFVSSSEVIFHMATRNRGDPIEVFRVSALGTANVVACAVTVGHRHIVFPSSNHIDSHPDSAYSMAKNESERLLCDVAGVNDSRVTVFRLPNVYGPGALPFYVSVVATFCYLQAQRCGSEMPIIGDGSQVIELVQVSTVVNEFLAAVDQKEYFTLKKIEGKEISVRQLAEV